MIATASGAMLAGVAEAEPRRIWFGRGGCVEQHDDGTFAVFVRGELLGVYADDDVGSRDIFIAVVRDQAEREELARAFRVSPATVGRVITRFNEGGLRAVADYGRHGGRRVRTPALVKRLRELFEKGLGPRAAHQAVAKKASYGTVYAIHQEWQRERLAKGMIAAAAHQPANQPTLAFIGGEEEMARLPRSRRGHPPWRRRSKRWRHRAARWSSTSARGSFSGCWSEWGSTTSPRGSEGTCH